MWKMLNKAQADALFESEAVLMGTCDRVPIERVRDLMCDDALEFAMRMAKGCVNGYGIGGYTASGMDANGFRIAVTWMNIRTLRESGGGIPW